jgi:DNA polymerase
MQDFAKSLIYDFSDNKWTCKNNKCSLFGNNIVFSEGNLYAKYAVYCEAPGKDEDIIGRPLVGRSGKFFDSLLSDNKILRDEFYISNIVKCRPPNNKLDSNMISCCSSNLKQEISMVKANIILIMGNTSLNALTGLKGLSISRYRGRILPCLYNKEVSLFTTYHPSSQLYDPGKKDIMQEDFRRYIDLVNKGVQREVHNIG